MPKKKDSYDRHSCGFKNESECEEDLEDDGTSLDNAEDEHFEDEETSE